MGAPQKDEDGPVADAEFRFSWSDFRQIAAIVHADAGIVLGDSKAHLVYSRLAKRLRAIGLRNFRDYCALVRSESGIDERQRLIAAMTTNVTRFFREPHHFEFLSEHVLPKLAERARTSGRIRIWSAGCSSGEEPYSIAITLAEALAHLSQYDVLILATDIDQEVLERATVGSYPAREIEDIPRHLRQRWFSSGRRDGAEFGVAESLRELIRFKELNLLGKWPMQGKFDAIFCRNVLIYFDEATQNEVWSRFAGCLQPGGHLFIGHSERIPMDIQPFELVSQTTYRLVR
jgi:chemotaxis protein methyltransferase CheR